ncbi:hypothetical protein [Dankookia sp. P2]|uniref:hypothetical protein n=1 Tax=Dankookia sp. P2 TaxID=3423955 RepID=UPI003D67D4D7
MIRTLLLASTLALGTAGAALAEGPHIVGGGRDQTVVYDAPGGNVVGGGYARITGEAGNRTMAYGGTPQTQASSGLLAEITGEANNRRVTYRQGNAAPSGVAAIRSSQSGS